MDGIMLVATATRSGLFDGVHCSPPAESSIALAERSTVRPVLPTGPVEGRELPDAEAEVRFGVVVAVRRE